MRAAASLFGLWRTADQASCRAGEACQLPFSKHRLALQLHIMCPSLCIGQCSRLRGKRLLQSERIEQGHRCAR